MTITAMMTKAMTTIMVVMLILMLKKIIAITTRKVDYSLPLGGLLGQPSTSNKYQPM